MTCLICFKDGRLVNLLTLLRLAWYFWTRCGPTAVLNSVPTVSFSLNIVLYQ